MGDRPQRSASPGWTRLAMAVWVAAVTASIVHTVLGRWVCDDIYITFRYCDNLLAGLGPVYNAGERSEGYTHFLWFLLLTLGRALGIEAATLGRWVGIPFYVGSLLVLGRLSARLFPGRGGWAGVPVAMLGWAAHADARLFGSGGLETAAFTFFLLLGFEFTFASQRPRRAALSGWAFAVACLLRPDGLLYSVLAVAFLAWRPERRREIREFVPTWLVLVAPLFVFRMLYYGWLFPNPYYAKSGGHANWAQGILYARMYFQSYFVLAAGLVAAVPLAFAWRRRAQSSVTAASAGSDPFPALLFAWVAAATTLLYVVRVGGDFMFGRFFLPTTPFLLLLIEWMVHRLPRLGLRVVAAAAVVGLVVTGGLVKQSWLSGKRNVWGIVDEPQFYPDYRLRGVLETARRLRDCLAGTDAVLMVQGGQASLAYYARFPVAIERYGLTDETIAHTPIQARGRPGHEKYAPAEYIYERRVNLRINWQPVRSVPIYTLWGLGDASGEIIVYDRELMEHMKQCHGARFLDFPLWLEQTYLPSVPTELEFRLRRDWNHFQLFYFMHNPDPERLRERLRAALAERGITGLPDVVSPSEPFEDLGAPTGGP